MPLTRQDAEQLLEQLYATAEVLGSEIKPAAASLMIRDLKDRERGEVEQALARCRSELSGRLTLAAILERMASSDDHLTPNEAWAKALESQDENATVVWTDEIAKAMGAASPVLELGDKVGARMAFISAYEREVAASKARGEKPRWWPTLGDSKELRKEAIDEAIKQGRLESPKVKHLLPAPTRPEDEPGYDPEKRAKVMAYLRDLLNQNDEAARQRRQEEVERFEKRRQEVLDQAEKHMAGVRP
ncbi:hypothetical protein [uncultured Halomonas sp.]|uniref:hypothetical protein n=1 Tax=uncultured Halomonas sp. TaxID=173971 RepID=UPI002599DF66|nr:hypothetical protein [uncultured Halomonas sp.]